MSRNCTTDTTSALKTKPRELFVTVSPVRRAASRACGGSTLDMRNSRRAKASGRPDSLSGNCSGVADAADGTKDGRWRGHSIDAAQGGFHTPARVPFQTRAIQEVITREGFGHLIGFLGANGSYEGMFAVVLTVAFIGFAVDRAYQLLMQRVLQWRE